MLPFASRICLGITLLLMAGLVGIWFVNTATEIKDVAVWLLGWLLPMTVFKLLTMISLVICGFVIASLYVLLHATPQRCSAEQLFAGSPDKLELENGAGGYDNDGFYRSAEEAMYARATMAGDPEEVL